MLPLPSAAAIGAEREDDKHDLQAFEQYAFERQSKGVPVHARPHRCACLFGLQSGVRGLARCCVKLLNPLARSTALRSHCSPKTRSNVPDHQTLDEGVSWADLFHPVGLYPSRLAGGFGTNPQRWYLGAYLSATPGGGTYYRSDDDGATWSAVLTLSAGQSVGGLTSHASAPDRVYAGITTGQCVVESGWWGELDTPRQRRDWLDRRPCTESRRRRSVRRDKLGCVAHLRVSC